MSYIQLSIPTQSSPTREARAWLEALSVGQRLSAAVIAQPGPGLVTLRVGGQTLLAETRVPLGVGAAVEVVVTKTSPGVLLRTVQPATVVPGSSLQPGVARAGSILPVALSQTGSSLVEVLVQVARLQSARTLPAAMAPLAGRLIAAIPDSGSLAGAAPLRAALLGSGTWLEALLGNSLLQGNRVSDRDIKMLLAKLLISLRTGVAGQPASRSMSELEASVKSSLIGITGNQLKSAGSELSQTWYLTLPFTWQGQFQYLQASIWRESEPDRRAQEQATDRQWQVRLQMEPAGIGKLEIEVSLKSTVVLVGVVADSTPALTQMKASQDRLAQALARSGLELGGLHVQLRSAQGETPQAGVDTNA